MFGWSERKIMILQNHHDPRYLQQKIDQGYSSKDIAKELRISYKLVEIYLAKFGIPFVSSKPQV